MIFGNLSNVLENEQTIYEAVQQNISDSKYKKITQNSSKKDHRNPESTGFYGPSIT